MIIHILLLDLNRSQANQSLFLHFKIHQLMEKILKARESPTKMELTTDTRMLPVQNMELQKQAVMRSTGLLAYHTIKGIFSWSIHGIQKLLLKV